MATLKKAVFTNEGDIMTITTQTNTFTLDVQALSSDISQQALRHGLKQKIADVYSGTTLTHEIDAKIDGVLAGLVAGIWNAGRSSSGGLWVEALARAAGVEVDVALEKWNEMDDDTKALVKKDAGVKLAKAQIDLERAQAKDTGEGIDIASL